MADLNPLSFQERCGKNMDACVAGFGIGVLLVLLLIIIYYFLFSRPTERMVNLASAYNSNPEALRLAQGIMGADPAVTTLPRKERMAENTSDRMAGYLWS